MSRAWMPMYWGDYLADTQHLTTLQHGAYILLIAHYWQHGSLPDDERAIAQISRLSTVQWNSNGQAIAKLFLPGWKHKRVEQELEKLRVLSHKRAMAGQRGGKSSRGKDNFVRQLPEAFAKQPGAQSPKYITSTFSVAAREGLPKKNSGFTDDELRALYPPKQTEAAE